MAGGSARYVAWRPAAALRPYVVSMLGYDMVLDCPGSHRGLPSTQLTVVVPVGRPIGLGWYGRAGSRGDYWSCVSGLHTTPAEIHHAARLAGIQLDLTPLAARGLLGLPAGQLSGVLVELGDVAPALADLPERLAGVTTWRDRLRLVESRLLHVLSRTPERAGPRPEVGWALRRLSQPSTVAGVASEVGLSRRHFGELFRAEYGVTPKQYQRIARFQAARSELVRQARSRRVSLARVAAGHGYADQAHLTREWTALAGSAPSAWLRAEFPFLQDNGAGPSVP